MVCILLELRNFAPQRFNCLSLCLAALSFFFQLPFQFLLSLFHPRQPLLQGPTVGKEEAGVVDAQYPEH